ncbi:sideroflexin-2 isoform X3 [Cherax quadricarinatus]|uniref:sideroflexin-2 isoform X3 n=1 Tax=Cherax quadricarinatus TaxID=27406 RepID=UPI00387EB896
MDDTPRINLDVPRYDQSQFIGRLRHFFGITDWRLCFKTDRELEEVKELLERYRHGQEPPGTTEEKIWYAKRAYESAFHPDTGDKQNVIGRMCFQVPGGMILTGAMLTFYKSTSAVVFWQWANQSFNALVNFTNRNAKSPLSETQLAVAYVSATGAALATALGLKSFLAGRASTLLQVDACESGVGAVLLQIGNKELQPVAYFSAKFQPHQRAYSTIEKEALALVLALEHFDVYVGQTSQVVTVYSDHNPLVYLQAMKNHNTRLMRWTLRLQPYNFKIQYIAGKENVLADSLSRV